MITAEIKINGSLIGYVYAVNKGKIIDKGGKYSKEEPCIYEVVYFNCADKKMKEFPVQHNRVDGFEELMRLIFDKITKKGAK